MESKTPAKSMVRSQIPSYPIPGGDPGAGPGHRPNQGSGVRNQVLRSKGKSKKQESRQTAEQGQETKDDRILEQNLPSLLQLANQKVLTVAI